MIFASPQQINAQLPVDFQGSALLRVTTYSGYSEVPVTVTDAAPAVFASGVVHANGAPVDASHPAIPGETVVIYLTGLGQVNPSIATGQAAPASPLLSVVIPVTVNFGSVTMTPSFAGLTPGFAGVYQVNVAVPNLTTNTYPVRVVAEGNVSNSMNVPVQGRTP